MIIFDLDTLADCEHRRHFVDPRKNVEINHKWIDLGTGETHLGIAQENGEYRLWQPNYRAFYEACGNDTPIEPTKKIIKGLFSHDYYGGDEDVRIWSGRCESVRNKTEKWLSDNYIHYQSLKMRPIGDNTPDHELKERWLDEYNLNLYPPLKPMSDEGIMDESIFKRKDSIQFVFDSDPKSIAMWKRRGIFVFNCAQEKYEL